MSDLTLAIHVGHNASACIGDRSGIRFAIQEERLRGEKNYWGFPERAIDACLKATGAAGKDVDTVALGGTQVSAKHQSREDVVASFRRTESLTGKLRQRVAVPVMSALQPNFGKTSLSDQLARSGLGKAKLAQFDHHLTHAATAWYGLRSGPADKALVLTCDGDGDGLCATVRVFDGRSVKEVARSAWANSLGALYAWVTYGMGFVPLEHEYKLMGMAPYASDAAAAETAKVFRRYLWLDESGLSFERTTFRRTNDLAESLFADLKHKRFDHVCAGIQRFTEELLCAWVANCVRATGVKKVLAAGGVFLNVKANKKIAELPDVASFEAFPSCADESLPIGAYWLAMAERFGPDAVQPLPHLYLGDDFDDATAEAALKKSGFAYEKPAKLADAIAALLAQGHPVARAAGRMEYGQRALGNRSILADPGNGDIVRVINRMVKKRDFWMPFSPVILAERAGDYLKNPRGLKSPFMTMTFDTKDNFKELIAAVHNADLTCRPQLLERAHDPAFHDLLKAFEARTGRGALLNTSFNLHGYPIVRTPDEALHVFRQSGLEHLQLGPFVVHKR